MVDGHLRYERASATIAAARRYRDALRRYLAEQQAAINRGATMDELMTRHQALFQEAMQAERELFALLDALDLR
jgi:hypothetical protein